MTPADASPPPSADPSSASSVDLAVLDQVEVVLVAYRSRDHVAALLASWPATLRVVVVDNGADVDGLRALVADRPHTRYLDGGGVGFARAANLGASSGSTPYVVFVNPDSRPQAVQLADLVSGLAADPAAAAHAGTPIDRDGAVEIGAGGWEPSLRRTFVYSSGLHKRFPTAGMFATPRPGEVLDVDWVCGACMAVRREQFATLGGFDESFFVYTEDLSFGRRARLAGRRSVLRTDLLIPHGAGGSGAPSKEMLRLRGASFAGYLRRYHPGPAGVAMRVVFGGGAALRGLWQRLRGDRPGAVLNRALATGVATRRAYVGTTEVARARFEETERDPDRARIVAPAVGPSGGGRRHVPDVGTSARPRR